MPDYQHEISKFCNHKKNKYNTLLLFNSIKYCLICSKFIFKNISSYEYSQKVIIPSNFNINKEYSQSLQLLEKNNKQKNIFINKKDYLKLRSSIIKNMKGICSYFFLSFKTYFLSVEYLDRICSQISSFNENILFPISLFCIILASKFAENNLKALEVQSKLREKVSKNFLVDEIYILKLLNYNLNLYTSYDILIDIMSFGFIFENEDFNYNILNILYSNIPKILYTFSQSNSYLDMTAKQVAISIIGFSRELLNLNPFNENIRKIFKIDSKNENVYILGLKIIKKKIKIENE